MAQRGKGERTLGFIVVREVPRPVECDANRAALFLEELLPVYFDRVRVRKNEVVANS